MPGSAKTLYISDLDGTLLDGAALMPPGCVEILAPLLDRGLSFTVSTARTPATAAHLLKDLRLKLPALLMMGVVTYDLRAGRPETVRYLDISSARALLERVRDCGVDGFLYAFGADGTQYTFYERAESPQMRAFIREREIRYNKVFIRTDSLLSHAGDGAVFFSAADAFDKIVPLRDSLRGVPGIHVECYRDIYNKDMWYIEVCSDRASKKNSLIELRERYGFERVVAFGDNYNDLPMFEAADISFAVANAPDAVKERADGVIGPNTELAVPKKIRELFLAEQ